MTDTRRILILTADAGFGHRSAANAIADALRETRGDACAVAVVNPLEDKLAPAFLRRSQTDYDKIVRQLPDLYKFGFQASDSAVPSALAEGALTVVLFEVMRRLVHRQQPDVIVSTYPLYQAPLGAVYTIGRRSIPLLTVVTDLASVHRLWFQETADLCLVPTPQVRDLAVEAGLGPDRVRVTGIPVHPQFLMEERPPAALRAELGWQPDLTTLLAVGGKRVKHLNDILRGLNHSGLPLQLALIAGGDDELHRRWERADWHLPVHIYNFVDTMPAMMRAADAILCKAGGLIITEALACGLPLLLADVIPGQETGNADYVIEGGAGELARQPLDALESLHHWLARGGELLARRAACARRLGRPRAAYEVADLAWAAAER
jgi:1,2-diacylglycerol 3-beta-galactosyltransferase